MAYGRGNWNGNSRGGNRFSGGNGRFGGGNRGGRGRGNRASTAARITGLFKTQKQGLYVGGADGEQLEALIEKIKAAKAKGRGITFFMWRSDFEEGPPYSLTVDVAQEDSRGGGGGSRGRRRPSDDEDEIEEQEEDVETIEDGDDNDDLFGKKSK